MFTLITSLYKFATRVKKRPSGGEGFAERYNFFVTTSEYGENCGYARKCADLFLSEDYEDIRTLFLQLLSEFRKIEGDGFGR